MEAVVSRILQPHAAPTPLAALLRKSEEVHRHSVTARPTALAQVAGTAASREGHAQLGYKDHHG